MPASVAGHTFRAGATTSFGVNIHGLAGRTASRRKKGRPRADGTSMPALDLESLTKPVSADDPCGVDLDLSGDMDFLNYMAGAEGQLPKSFFGRDQAGNEGRPFDRTSIKFDEQFDAARPFLEKTRDLRLLGLLAKFSILNRDLAGFINCVRAVSTLLSDHWEAVHPRGEDGDYGLRMVAVEALDALPTVVIPLQFLPLIEHKRYGLMSYRAYMIAKGELAPRDGEDPVDAAAIDKILDEAELSELVARRGQLLELVEALKQIRQTWNDNSGSGLPVTLERLPNSVGQIFAMLDAAIAKRDPAASLAASPAAAQDGATEAADGQAAPVVVGKVGSSAQAALALAAVAKYFSAREPSNPALLLVRQADALLGKSFLEVMRVLVPTHVDKAAINIGKDQSFDLPIERLSGFAEDGQGQPADQSEGAEGPQFEARTRAEALALLEQVSHYFRTAEPSSPIPFLTDRARDLAQRDFLSVLKALLPADALRPKPEDPR
jgi:type VI secretion system protein ImpA